MVGHAGEGDVRAAGTRVLGVNSRRLSPERTRGRAWRFALLCFLLAGGCDRDHPSSSDSGPEIGRDAGVTLPEPDAGYVEVEPDAGHVLKDAGTETPDAGKEPCVCPMGEWCSSGGCTKYCAECSSSTPCKPGGVCISTGIADNGSCLFPIAECSHGEAHVPDRVVINALYPFGCGAEYEIEHCRTEHILDIASGGLLLRRVRVLADGSSVLLFETRLDYEINSSTRWSAAYGNALCTRTEQLRERTCVNHGDWLEVVFEGDAGTAAFAFDYNSGRQPPLPLYEELENLLKFARPHLAGAGLP